MIIDRFLYNLLFDNLFLVLSNFLSSLPPCLSFCWRGFAITHQQGQCFLHITYYCPYSRYIIRWIKFIILPFCRIIFDIIHDSYIRFLIADNYIIKTFLPFKSITQPVCMFCYRRFVRSGNGRYCIRSLMLISFLSGGLR